MVFPVVMYGCEIWTIKKAIAAAQSCPTLCDPIDGSPPDSPVPGSPGKNTGVGCHFLLQCRKVKSQSEVVQLCLPLSNPMDCSLLGSSVHGIFQAIVLDWIAIFFSRGSSQPRARTQVSCIVDRRFTVWATREVPVFHHLLLRKISSSHVYF